MSEASKFRLLVTAGSSYDTSEHQLVPVNLSKPIHVKSDRIEAKINIRVQNYRGLPAGSPSSSPYFSHTPHEHDLYSIGFSFTLPDSTSKATPDTPETTSPASSINGADLLFGNDFDHPIRDRLPPGFNTAFRIVRWAIDPGLNGDVYADEPYLYGPLLSSINTLRIGGNSTDDTSSTSATTSEEGSALEEGASGSGAAIRSSAAIPSDNKARMKHFLTESKRQEFTFEGGREYGCDFYNPYLDFNEFSLKLPGFTLPIIRYWDGQPLRYVLKRKSHTDASDKGQELLVVLFTLVPEEKAEAEERKWVESGRAKTALAAREEAGAAVGKSGKMTEGGKRTGDDDDVD
ncbi:MAG: hypothetical protein M1828_002274 [Chrysothrix sp. TS-e1954]|nr:MAG: hypothetical protein M1828_002274 [Chrysothrix sp. TS-e1954]